MRWTAKGSLKEKRGWDYVSDDGFCIDGDMQVDKKELCYTRGDMRENGS